jgi:acetyl esterase/lipase
MAHPDRWFAALARSYLEPRVEEAGVDEALVARLELAAASGDYAAKEAIVEAADAPGPHGPVPVRVYRPTGSRPSGPPLVWLHGGGFGAGDLDMPEADATSREVSTRSGSIVVSVDYRLATRGVHFPVPHDDTLAAVEWTTRVFGPAAIGGASAGANLAAGAALRLRDEGRPPLGVLLAYPLVHPVLPTPSRELAVALARLPLRHRFSGASFTPMVENYLGSPVSEASPYAFAALGQLRGFPPTFIIDAEYDGLRASGEAFADALVSVDVPLTRMVVRDVLHGHLNSPWLPQAQQSYADMAAWLRTLPQ